MAHVIGDGADKDSLTGYSMMRFAGKTGARSCGLSMSLDQPLTNLEPRMT